MDYLDDEQAPKKSVAHHCWNKKVIFLPGLLCVGNINMLKMILYIEQVYKLPFSLNGIFCDI